MFWKSPVKSITDIMYLPGIDPDPKERVNDLREKIMRKNKEMGLLG